MQKVTNENFLIYHAFGGSCNGCDIEVKILEIPKFSMKKYGLKFTYDPEKANIILITGILTYKCLNYISEILKRALNKQIIIAVGDCAVTGGIFFNSYTMKGPVDRVIPVDIYVSGCPPNPKLILHGLLKAVTKIREKKNGV